MTENFEQFGLGRLQSPFDRRDYNLANFIPLTMPTTIATNVSWDFPADTLDQMETGHCGGFGGASFGINLPVHTPYTNEDGHRLYYLCKIVDGKPGSEEGTYIRSIAKVLQNEGRIEGYAFAPSLEVIKWWLFNRGPLIVGTIWTEEMFMPNKDNVITIGGKVVGGHAYLINEWTSNDYIGIQNSWGNRWGKKGKAYIAASDFEKLFTYGGEAMAAVELPHPGEAVKPKKECFFIQFMRILIKELFSKK